MAQVMITTESGNNVTIDTDDEGAAELLANIAFDFGRRGGIWLGGGSAEVGVLAWIPREHARIGARFDGPLPPAANALLPFGEGMTLRADEITLPNDA